MGWRQKCIYSVSILLVAPFYMIDITRQENAALAAISNID